MLRCLSMSDSLHFQTATVQSEEAGAAHQPNILCKLPVEVVRQILSAFLNLADIVRLDSASLVRSDREQIQLRYQGTTPTNVGHLIINLQAAQWLTSRAVSLHFIMLSHSMIDGWSTELSPMMREVKSILVYPGISFDCSRANDVFGNCSQLQRISLKHCKVQSDALQVIMSLCPQLRELDLTNADVRIIGPLLSSRLTALTLSMSKLVDDDTIIAVATACTNLRILMLDHCHKCTRVSVDAIATNLPQLQQLGLLGWRDLPDQSITSLVASCTDLRGIHFANSDMLSSGGIFALAAHCQRLELFSLNCCEQVTVAAFVALVSSCPAMHYLRIDTANEIFAALSAYCPSLSTLIICPDIMGHMPGIPGELVARLLRNCPSLHHLSISQFSPLPSCEGLVSSVEILHLSWAPARDDEQVSSLVRLCPRLRELHLEHCWQVSDATILLLAECCPLLQAVSLEGMANLTDASVVALSQRCPHLRHTNLRSCVQLTDVAVVSIAQYCLQLAYLNIGSFPSPSQNFTDVSIAALTLHSKRLRELDVSNNTIITEAALSALACAVPKCMLSHRKQILYL